MMPNVVRGDRMAGLMVYLAGPGRKNEHTSPHLVAGNHALMTWYGDNELGREEALEIARYLDKPRATYGTDVMAGIYERQQVGRDAKTGQPKYKNVRTGERQAHVWHCSLSLRADEGELSDEKWQEIAEDFITAMGFDDHEGSKATCRWTAVRHGTSADGNDHVHIAVNLVREDGTKASVHKDFHRAQQTARALEMRHGLERLESSVAAETSTRGFTPAEQRRGEIVAQSVARKRVEKAGGAGAWDKLDATERRRRVSAETRLNIPRVVLARKVRAAATAAGDEAEFVRRMRRTGLLVRPRFAEGTQDVVVGYSVAARPKNRAERPIWYGGRRLGRDLALPRLRGNWPDDPAVAGDAAAEWRAAWRGKRVVAPGREMRDPAPELWQEQAAELARVREQLRNVPLDDRTVWPQIARQAAGTLAAWSTRVEAAPGHLAAAADTLSKSAQTYRRQPRTLPKPMRDPFAQTALLMSAAAKLGKGPIGEAALLNEMIGFTRSLADVAAAAGQVRHAAALRAAAEQRLERVHARMPAAAPVKNDTAVLERQTTTVRPPAAEIDPELRQVIDRMQAGRARAADAVRDPLPTTLTPEKTTISTTTSAETEADVEHGR